MRNFFIPFTVFLISIFLFWQILFNLGTTLVDWHDYPLLVANIWQYQHNFSSFYSFSTFNLWFFPMFYPATNAQLFSDSLLAHGLVASLFGFFTNNPILVFNLLFFATLLLNVLGAYYLWRQVFKRPEVLFFATLTTALSPYFFSQISHFQMISFWPLLFILGILLKEKTSRLELVSLSLLLVIQFLTSVYLWLFSGVVIGVWLMTKGLRNLETKKLGTVLLSLLLVSPLLWQYRQVKSANQVSVRQEELLVHSAQISDYLLVWLPDTLVSQTPLATWIQSWNHNLSGEKGVFPGIVLTGLAIVGLWAETRRKKPKTKRIRLLFFGFMIFGFIFSLGPRCQINGFYCQMPLPYWGAIKLFPFLDTFDALARWSLLFYLGLSYFAALGLEQFIKKIKLNNFSRLQRCAQHCGQGFLISGFIIIYSIETFPLFRIYRQVDYFTAVHQYLQTACLAESKVLLRYPFDQRNGFVILESLEARTTDLLGASQHECHLVNGYSGLAPTWYPILETRLNIYFSTKEFADFLNLVSEQKTTYLQIKHSFLSIEEWQAWQTWVAAKQTNLQVLASDETSVLYLLR